MGNFYVNISAKVDRPTLKSMLDHMPDRSVIGPEGNGWLTFTSEHLETQDQEVIDAYGVGLSQYIPGPMIAVLNHDDDILSIDLFEGGKRTATYNSCPGYFDERATEADLEPKFSNSEAFDALAPDGGVTALLKERPVFAVEAHAAFAKAVGLPAAGFGFCYVERRGI